MTIIVGVNAFHADSSACLLRSGQLVAAAEEERFTRIKHWAGLPEHALGYCLDEAGLDFGEIDIIAVNTDPRANLWRKILHTIRYRPDLGFLRNRLRSRRHRQSLADTLAERFGAARFGGKVHQVEHHVAHLASAFLTSPFEKAALVSVDGFGDFASTAWGVGTGRKINTADQVYFPHSLGIFYETITHFLGFKRYGDEYKVMGLAPYGKDRFRAEMEKLVRLEAGGKFTLGLEYFRHHEGQALMQWENCEPEAGDYFNSRFTKLLGSPREPDEQISQRHMDIACSAQSMYESALFHLLSRLHLQCGADSLVMSGGCAYNSVANGKIYDKTPFKKVYIQAAAGDAGGALGAALHAWNVGLNQPRAFAMSHAYWGAEFSDEDIARALLGRRAELGTSRCRWEHLECPALLERVAGFLAAGRVVAWFQGRMEWGPRALGNRSILADPRRAEMRNVLNAKIKRRESFRPFAPTVLREHVSEWFETDDDVPFMMKVFAVRESKRREIPAVTHIDGSSRLQTLEENQNPKYYQLIKQFHSITDVPMLLNTSFNENEPIVQTPDQAIDSFLRTRMDALALSNHLIVRADVKSPDSTQPVSAEGNLENVGD
jgi:carbamoyltransferase